MTTESDAGVRSGGQGPQRPDPLVVAHRGASAAHPENTLPAFAAAAGLGADWVELDVRRTADGTLVVHHDARLPDGRIIFALDATELPPSVPSLGDALATCAAAGLGVNVEIKSDSREPDFDPQYRVADEVSARLETDGDLSGSRRYLVTSFDWRCIARVKRRAPALATGQLAFSISDTDELFARTSAAGHVAVNPWDPFVDEPFMSKARDRGLQVYPWTVDDPDRMTELIDLGVDGVITNVPDRLRKILGTRL